MARIYGPRGRFPGHLILTLTLNPNPKPNLSLTVSLSSTAKKTVTWDDTQYIHTYIFVYYTK